MQFTVHTVDAHLFNRLPLFGQPFTAQCLCPNLITKNLQSIVYYHILNSS